MSLTKFDVKGELTCPNCKVPRQPFHADGDLRLNPREQISFDQFCTTPECLTKLTLTLSISNAERINKKAGCDENK